MIYIRVSGISKFNKHRCTNITQLCILNHFTRYIYTFLILSTFINTSIGCSSNVQYVYITFLLNAIKKANRVFSRENVYLTFQKRSFNVDQPLLNDILTFITFRLRSVHLGHP